MRRDKNPVQKAADGSGQSSGQSSGQIIELMKRHPNITAVQIAEQLGLTERAIQKQISKLRKENAIDRIGPNKGGHWVVPDADDPNIVSKK